MKMRFLLFLIFGLTLFVKAQESNTFKVYDHKKLIGNTLKVYAEDGLILISVLKPNLLEVAYLKEELTSTKSKVSEIPENYIRVTQNLEKIYLETDSLMLSISKLDFSIRFKSIKNQTLLLVDSAKWDQKAMNLNFLASKETSFKNSKSVNFKLKEYDIDGKTISLINNKSEIKFHQTLKGRLNFKAQNQFIYQLRKSNSIVFQFSLIDFEPKN